MLSRVSNARNERKKVYVTDAADSTDATAKTQGQKRVVDYCVAFAAYVACVALGGEPWLQQCVLWSPDELRTVGLTLGALKMTDTKLTTWKCRTCFRCLN